MLRHITIAALVALLITATSATAMADDQPLMMPINGFLTDTDGVVIDGPVDMTFSLYADPSSDDPFFSETLSITVDQGVFHEYIGSTEDLLTADLKDHPGAYVAVAIDSDSEMERWPLGDVPYAAVANYAHDAATVGGLGPDDLGAQGADQLAFDDSDAGLDASSTQQAIEILAQRVAQLESEVGDHDTAIDNLTDDLSSQSSSIASLDDDLTSTQSDVASLQSDVSGNSSQLSTLDSNISANTSDIATNASNISANASDLSSLQTQVDDLDIPQGTVDRLDDLEDLTAPMTRMSVNGQDSIVFEDVNVHVQSGAGATDADVNGRGNLIVGYDESGFSSEKTGSHNIVFGKNATYTSFGGLVGGSDNAVHGQYSSAISGNSHTVEGDQSVVISGSSNTIDGDRAAILAGSSGTAEGNNSAIVSGFSNLASGTWSSVVGGSNNEASGMDSVVVGGSSNEATGSQDVVVD